MKFKRITSFIIATAMLLTTAGNLTATAEEATDITISYTDYEPGAMPESIMKWAAPGETEAKRSGERGWLTSSRNTTAIDTDKNFDGSVLKIGWGDDVGSYSPRSIYTVNAIADGTDIGADGMASTVYTAYDPSRTPNYFKMDNSKNYVFRVYIKDNYPDQSPAPVVNFAVSNDSAATRAWSKEYGEEGFSVTGEYKAYAGTFNLPDNFNNDGRQTVSAGFMIGNGAGESISFKTGKLGDVYFAEEVAYNIKVSEISEENNKESVTLKAEVLNQIGSTGYLEQDFVWKVRDARGVDVTEKMEIELTDGTSTASITTGKRLDNGTYVAYAISADYQMTRSFEFDIEKEKECYNIYVDAEKGDDENPGTEQAPLKTFRGAKELVRRLKAETPGYQYTVNFRDGEYYFEETERFTEEDSGQKGSPVIYRAINPGKVIFTGGVELDISKAKKVTDKEFLARLYEGVRDKVYEIDLLNSGFPYTLNGETKHPSAAGPMLNSIEYPELYLDNQEQMIAQWPNGEGNYSKVDLVVDKTSFRCKNDDFSRWTAAKDMWVGGYYVYDYGYRRHYVEEIDGDLNIITLEDTGVSTDYMGQLTNISMRYKAFNLPEEIDVPGEWYIDRENMKIYYYMPENISGKRLELSALRERMFVMTDADYIKFSGIEFTKTRDEVIYMTGVSGIEITDCTFRNVLASAITANSTKLAETDKDYWQVQEIDGANNCIIENCLFENIGAAAISITGGNVDTLEESGTVIRNNIFYKFGQKARYTNAIKIYGCGITVENNNISSAPCSAIATMGNNHIIRYNEIYDVCRETDDCGAIYQGRSALQRGTEVSYNYLHNLNSVEELPYKFQNGIYWDDSQGGQYVHDNIIKDVRQDIYNAGVDNVFEDNISINVEKTLYFKNGKVPTHNNDETKKGWYGYIKNPDIYYAEYPNLEYIINNYNSESLASLTRVNGNLAVNAGEVALEDKVSATGNIQTDKTDIFMGSDVQDYRISKDIQAELGISNNLNEDFDIDLIGVQSGLSVGADSFGLNCPGNGEIIADSGNMYFNWESLTGANRYELVISKDAGFGDVVYRKETPYNSVIPKLLLEDGRYYWKVEAKNTSREFGFNAVSGVYTFTVGEDYSLTDFQQSVEGNKRTVTGKLTYEGDGEQDCGYVYVAAYDSDNRLKSVSKKNYSFTKGVGKDIECELLVNTDDFYIKVFVWSSENAPKMTAKTFVMTD